MHSLKTYKNPITLMIITAVLIFWAEAVVMIVMAALPSMTIITEALVDAVLLTLLVFPTIYFLLIKPLQQYMVDNIKLEEKVEKLEAELSGYK